MEIAESNRAMWRGALVPSIVVSALSIIASTALRGVPGLWGSALAAFTVVIFFSVSLLVARLTKSADPIATMALAMFSYFTKLLLIAGFLLVVTRMTDEADVDRTSFGVSALAIALGWLAGEVRAFFKLRLQLPLPKDNSPNVIRPK
jgi:ATP synthase protein I